MSMTTESSVVFTAMARLSPADRELIEAVRFVGPREPATNRGRAGSGGASSSITKRSTSLIMAPPLLASDWRLLPSGRWQMPTSSWRS